MKQKISQKERVLNYLRAKKAGAFNYELNKICFRYGGRIKDLRDEGFQIISVPVDRPQGLWRYILIFDKK